MKQEAGVPCGCKGSGRIENVGVQYGCEGIGFRVEEGTYLAFRVVVGLTFRMYGSGCPFFLCRFRVVLVIWDFEIFCEVFAEISLLVSYDGGIRLTDICGNELPTHSWKISGGAKRLGLEGRSANFLPMFLYWEIL